LRVDLKPSVAGEHLPQCATVLFEIVCVGLGSEVLEQHRGALDVCEEERDRASRKIPSFCGALEVERQILAQDRLL
jgi:hypothetical protein